MIAAAVTLAGIANHEAWLAILFGLFAVSSLQALEGEGRSVIPLLALARLMGFGAH